MNKKIKDYIDKQFKEFREFMVNDREEFKNFIYDSTQEDKKEFNNNQLKRFINKVNDSLTNHRLKINDLINRDTYNREYIKALNFLSWFSWDKLHSKILAEEAKNKLYSELKYTQVNSIYGDLNQLNRNLDDIDFNYIITGKYNSDKCNNLNTTISIATSDLVYCDKTCIVATNYKDEKIEEPPKPTYNDYVKAVVKTPHKFNKEIIYNVYKYLLEIIEKDKIASKYKV